MKVTIGGKELNLKFNNFAHIELAKLLFPEKHLIYNPNDVVDKLSEIAEINSLLLIKYLVYAGCAGYDMETGFSVKLNQLEVGELIGRSSFEETISVWDQFLKDMGLKEIDGLSDIMEGGQGTEQKKS